MKKLLLILTLLTFANVGYAKDYSNAGAFLEKGAGARPQSLGGAFTALSNDAHATMYNSAGLAQIKNIQFDSMYTKLYGDVDQTYFGGVIPIGDNAGLGITYFSAGVAGIKETTLDQIGSQFRATETGKNFDYGAKAIMIGYGVNVLPSLALGVTTKYINESMYNKQATGFGMDIGFLYNPFEDLKVGVNLQNVVKPALRWDTESNNTDTIPFKATIGVSQKINDFTLLYDATLRNNRKMGYGLGVEYNYQNLLSFRGGLNNSALTFGAGIKYDVFNFNYAYMGSPDGVLENNNSFSFGLSFDSVSIDKSTGLGATLPQKDEMVKLDVVSSTVIKPAGLDVKFSDMEDHWGKKAVEDMASLGVVNGRPDGNYDPNGIIKKSEATKIVLLALKLKQKAGNAEFSIKLNKDEKNNHIPIRVDIYNKDGVLVKNINTILDVNTSEKKLVWDGTDKSNKVVEDGVYKVKVVVENPYEEMNTAKELHVTTEYINIKANDKTNTRFNDVSSSHWASGIIQEAVTLGVVNGESAMLFKPTKPFTKLELVVAIAKALKKEGYQAEENVEISYKDAVLIPHKYDEFIKIYISALGAGGDEKGALNPNKRINRVEAATILARYLSTNKVFDTEANADLNNREVVNIESSIITQNISLEVYKTKANKVIIKGSAQGIKGLIIDGKKTSINSLRYKLFAKVDYAKDKEIVITAIDNNDKEVEIIVSFSQGNIIVQGMANKGLVVAVNNKSLYIKPTGQFFSKVKNSGNPNTILKVIVKDSSKNSSLAGL
ncbi:MAG: hypothetical protein DKM50_10480 [Candidatus Margulisiibacteriota bacterium]|nr:MAG: hypothetical protein DKM50_10480 [Candidatus Margulisiibacteriota bacterium]